MRSITIALLAVATSLVVSGCGVVKGKEAAEKAVTEFRERFEKRDFAQIYSASHPDFKAASTETDFVALLDAIHRKLGTLQKSDQTNWNINSFNLKTNVILTYKTTFAEGDAVETFNYRIDGDDAVLFGYNINSNALITK